MSSPGCSGAEPVAMRRQRAGGLGAAADALVSWNFKHLVQLRRIRGFHAVNVLRGHPLIEIRPPLEVIDDEA